ncbi:MAG: SAVED domain-containing protein [Pseudomonadota bacterium]
MAQAILARRDGDTFQSRQFWRKACCLLDPESPVVRVGFEGGPKGFDDIWVDYEPARGIQDQNGSPLLREHIQCKWHVAPNTYGYTELVDPEFINANAVSLLQRLRKARSEFAGNDKGARYRLLSNWRISPNDPLRQLVHQRSHTLRLDLLYSTATERSAMGAIRKLWMDHLGLDESELRAMLHTLAISEATDSLDDTRHALDPLLRIAGLRRPPPHASSFVYDDVIFHWMAQGRVEFDADTLRQACDNEGLLAERAEPAPMVFGVKSFEHATDKLEDRCTRVLNLVPHFLDRQIRPEADWGKILYPALKAFLLDAAKTGDRIRLVLDAHLTLSFAAGSVLNMKSGRTVEIEQRVLGKEIWAPDDRPVSEQGPGWAFDTESFAAGASDIAVAVSLTHDTAPRAREYITSALPNIKTLLVAAPTGGPGARSVTSGHHAFGLAEALAARMKAEKEKNGASGQVHLFVAAPGGFSFYLGQRQLGLGKVTLYEFDFEGGRGGSYRPALTLPVLS